VAATGGGWQAIIPTPAPEPEYPHPTPDGRDL